MKSSSGARRWAINGRFLTQRVTGVQRYATEIVRAIDELVGGGHPLAADLELEVLTSRDFAGDLELRSIPVRKVGLSKGHVWEQGMLPIFAGGGILSLANTAPILGRKQVVCIHDANTFVCPDSYSFQFRTFYRLLHPLLGRTAARIATVSNFSFDQLVRFGIAPAEKISVIANGHEHVLRWKSKHEPETLAASGPSTVVVLGSHAPHKNVGLILDLAEELAAAGVRIAVVGHADPRVFRNGPGYRQNANVVELGNLSDGALSALLSDCLCLAFPSLIEGFGLPPLEAMALGCPVVASNRASIPEVCGEGAIYASPFDKAEWICAILGLRSDSIKRAMLIAKGRKQASTYSWRLAAERYLWLMADLDGMHVPRP